MAADDTRVADSADAGEGDDFDTWVGARVSSLLRFAYLMTGSQEAAEESLQTALTKACEQWSRVRRMDDRDAYVRRMIVNAHISWWGASGVVSRPSRWCMPTEPARQPPTSPAQ